MSSRTVVCRIVVAVGVSVFSGVANGYVGAKLGVVDRDSLGGGFFGGVQLPWNLALDGDLVGYYKNITLAAGSSRHYFLQADLDPVLDFARLFPRTFRKGSFRPYLKAGFTYGSLFIDTTGSSRESTYGFGGNIGAGLDWYLGEGISLGLELVQSFISFNALTAGSQTVVAGGMTRVFNGFLTLKFFTYRAIPVRDADFENIPPPPDDPSGTD
ncbi:MAG: hypothetical protein V1495_08320 [Pseudomonadota bacterium]